MDTPPALRYGWTTGACAAAAAKAAMIGLMTGSVPPFVSITLPIGQTPEFPVLEPDVTARSARAFIEKDAGDDPDVTHGALIGVTVSLRKEGKGVRFLAGEGVGTVTKPGLPVPVGAPAINPVPRAMILEALSSALNEYRGQEAGVSHDFSDRIGDALTEDEGIGLDLTISVPGGEKLALKTWNPRLGIVGGLSILGTTGVVRPFSCAAWIASIHRGIDVAVASGLDHVVGTTGATSEASVQRLYDLPDSAYLDMGDFVGGLLKYLRNHPVEKLTIAGGPGKMSKLAQGALDLHSKRSQVDFDSLSEWCGVGRVSGCNTALEAFNIAGTDLAHQVALRAHETVLSVLRGADIRAEIMVIDRSGELLARTDFR